MYFFYTFVPLADQPKILFWQIFVCHLSTPFDRLLRHFHTLLHCGILALVTQKFISCIVSLSVLLELAQEKKASFIFLKRGNIPEYALDMY